MDYGYYFLMFTEHTENLACIFVSHCNNTISDGNRRTYHVSPVPGCRLGENAHPVPGRELVENARGSVQPANLFGGLQRRQRAPVHHAEASPLGRRREQQVIPALPRVPERGAGERRLRLAGQHDVPEPRAPLHQHEP